MMSPRAVCDFFLSVRSSASAICVFLVLLNCSQPLFAQDANKATDSLQDAVDQLTDQAATIFPPLSPSPWLNPTSQSPEISSIRPDEVNRWYRAHTTNRWIRLRGRIDTDFLATSQSAADVATFGELGDQVGLRRARIGAEGNPTDDLRYVAEIDLATSNVVIRDTYFALGNLKEAGEYKFGHMREPFSLEGGTSANSYAFMERSLINSLDPARNWGVGYSSCGQQENWTFSGGFFQAGVDASDFQYGRGSTTALTTRWTGLAWYEDHGRNLMHFGLSLSERIPDNSLINVTQQPQSPLLSFSDSTTSPFVPRLKIPANFQELINVQWAYVNGSFWSQAEWYGTVINQLGGGPIFFHGSYLDVGYFLTGEQRSYLTKTGVFGPVLVNRPMFTEFSSKAREEHLGYGAWEATARLSYLDFLSSNQPINPQGQPNGVLVPQFTVGMNWYLADRMRLMFDYSYVIPYEINSGTSTGSVLGMRLGVFW